MLAALLNGSLVASPQSALNIEERGLSYGDGVFETMTLRHGVVRFLEDHLARLRSGCDRLGITAPSNESIVEDIQKLKERFSEGVLKLIVTRGAGGRGYRASDTLAATRIALLYPPIDADLDGITVRWCTTRLARNPQLAGIKHLNRLEQVLAQNEWHDPVIADGLMLDTEGEVVCGTSSNLFIVSDGVLSTPDLRFSGVRGVMRQQVLKIAQELGIDSRECSLWPADIQSASEMFLTNAVRGVRPIVALEKQQWKIGPITQRLMKNLETKE